MIDLADIQAVYYRVAGAHAIGLIINSAAMCGCEELNTH